MSESCLLLLLQESLDSPVDRPLVGWPKITAFAAAVLKFEGHLQHAHLGVGLTREDDIPEGLNKF